MLIAITVLLVGTIHLAEAQDAFTNQLVQVDYSLRKPRPKPQPPVRRVPEPSASLCLGMALLALAGYGWWSRMKSQVQY
jgi:hypothetical protein